MRRKFLLLLLTTFYTLALFAQNNIAISGKVVDKITNSNIPFANVVLFSQTDSKDQHATISLENGQFALKGVNRGNYMLTISYLGYKTISKEITAGMLNDYYDFGKIELEVDTLAIDVVTVEGNRSITSASLDKKTFSLSDNISQIGGSALEAMRNLPGVSINQEGKVLLRGSDKVSVLIDGKRSSLTGFGNQKGLDNIPASNIERIEIINNPSAKYSANGMAGVINIIYKKEHRSGFNGDVALNLGVGELSARRANMPNIMDKYSWTPKYNPSVNLNYRTEKVNLFLQSESMFREKVNCNEFTTRTYTDGTPAVKSQFLENRLQQEYNIKLGADWSINEDNELTIYGLFEDEYHIDKGDVPYDYIESGERKRLWQWAEDERTYNMNYGLDYKHQFSQPGHQISSSILFSQGDEDELFPFSDMSADHHSADSTLLNAKERIFDFTIDYVRPLKTGRLEVGTNMQLRNIPISYKVMPGASSILDPNIGEWSEYKENVYAVYINYVYESKYIDVEAGLRAENADIAYNIDPVNQYYSEDESYHNLSLFPNMRFTYKINTNHKVSIFYNRRVDRPGEFDLRPFPKYDDPEILKTGNPYLRPQYTQTAEIAYKTIWESGSLFISGYYKNIDDIFERIYTNANDGSGVIHSITQNLGRGNNLGAEIIIEQELTSKWKANASFNWYKNKINAFSGTVLYPNTHSFSFDESNNNTWNLKVNTSVEFGRGVDAQASFVYYAPDIIAQGKIKQRSSFDLGVRKKLLENKMELSISATDIFNTFALKKTIVGDGFNLISENYYETQVVTLGVKYKF